MVLSTKTFYGQDPRDNLRFIIIFIEWDKRYTVKSVGHIENSQC